MSLSERLAYSFFNRYRIRGRNDQIAPIYRSGFAGFQGFAWIFQETLIAALITQGNLNALYLSDGGRRTKPVYARLASTLARTSYGRLIRPDSRSKNWILTTEIQAEPWLGKKLFWSGSILASATDLLPTGEYLRALFAQGMPLVQAREEHAQFFRYFPQGILGRTIQPESAPAQSAEEMEEN